MRPDSRALLHDLPLFRLMPTELRQLVAERFTPHSYAFGASVVREGDDVQAFFVLASGRARVIRRTPNGEEIALRALKPGDSFGELGLSERGARAVRVRASSAIEVLRLDKAAFAELVAAAPELPGYIELELRTRVLSELFHHYPPLRELPLSGLSYLAGSLEELSVPAHSLVVAAGAEPGALHIVREGHLRAFTEEGLRRRYQRYLRRGDFFGDAGLFKRLAQPASVEAESDCHLLALRPQSYKELERRHPELRARMAERLAQEDYARTAHVPDDFGEENLPADAQAEPSLALAEAEAVGAATDPGLAKADVAVDPNGLFASPAGHFIKRGKRIRSFPFVRQIDEMDCGAACLSMVTRHFGRAVSLARIRQVIHTALDGTSLSGLCRGAEELGLAARSVKSSARNLDHLPVPAIVLWEGRHWVVVYDVDSRHVRLADPAIGRRKLPRAGFEQKWSGYAALFDYTTDFDETPEGRTSIAWLLPFFKPWGGILLRSLGLALVVSGLGMVVPVFTQVIVDRVLVDRDVGLLSTMMLALLALLGFMTLALLVQRYLLAFVAVRVDTAMLDALMRRLLSLPMRYFQSRRTGDIQRRLGGMAGVRAFLVENAVVGLTAVTQIGAAVALMFVYSPRLALVFLASAPLYGALMRFSSLRLRPMFGDLEEAFGHYASQQIDAIKGIETVKAMGAEAALRELMLRQFHGVATKLFRANFTMLAYDGAIGTVSFLATTLFLWVGAYQVMDGRLSIGGLMAFNALVGLANGPILSLLGRWDSYQNVRVLLDRLNDIFEQEPEQGADHTRLLPVRSLDGNVRLANVGFRYGGPESPAILDGLSFEVAAGQRVAIVGRSGSGKTTLVKLLAGLLVPTDGGIAFDGIDQRTLSYRELRRQIGFVLQENYLFNDSIARNIAFGEEEPAMERVLWAARMANAHEFIERLPLGYETRVGESGLALSGGQRQRIAIARALHNRPPILIFDEATSALDSESEKAVKENLDQLLEGRTSFIIAHRMSTIRDADSILVIEKGRLAEKGTHEELMQRQGLYYYLTSQQLGL